MVTVLLPYKENFVNFSVLLSVLQPQLSSDDDIYIIDSSPNKEALKLATIYGTTRSYIFVEPTLLEKSLEYGLQSMAENKQDALIFLNENCFISSTFIANMKKAVGCGYEIISPVVKQNEYYKMDNNFKFFNPTIPTISQSENFDSNCFMIVNSEDNDKYALLENEFVSILKHIPRHP